MVSFTCHRCQDVVKKPKVLSHAQSCGTSGYSCVDCMESFTLESVKAHNTCVSEEEKYQGRWKGKGNAASNQHHKGKHGHQQPIVDSDNEDEEAKLQREKALLQLRVRPSAKNFLASSDSDSDDDDWATGASGAKKSSDAHKSGKRDTSKKDKSVSPAATPRKRTRSAAPEAVGADEEPVEPVKTKKQKQTHTPLMLPRSTADLEDQNRDSSTNDTHAAKQDKTMLPNAEIIVESFSLGRQAEVQEIVQDILSSSSSGSGGNGKSTHHAMSAKAVAKELVDRYRNRIAKSVRAAVAAAVAGSDGTLSWDEDGNIVPVKHV